MSLDESLSSCSPPSPFPLRTHRICTPRARLPPHARSKCGTARAVERELTGGCPALRLLLGDFAVLDGRELVPIACDGTHGLRTVCLQYNLRCADGPELAKGADGSEGSAPCTRSARSEQGREGDHVLSRSFVPCSGRDALSSSCSTDDGDDD